MELALLLLFLALHPLAAVGVRRGTGVEDFVVAGRSSRPGLGALSLLATMLGASAVIGTASLASRYGWGAFVWLGSGVLGLGLLALLVHRVPFEKSLSLPDMLGKAGGNTVKWVSALVILPAWVGIVGAQLSAAGRLGAPFADAPFVVVAGASTLAIGLYVVVAGQRGVMRTDRGQIFLLIFLLLALLFGLQETDVPPLEAPLPLEDLPPSLFFDILLGAGFAFFIGPDIYSRLFTLPTPKARRRTLLYASVGLLLGAFLITAVGVLSRPYLAPGEGDSLLVLVPTKLWGPWGGRIISLGVLAAVLSSADTCLLTAATILSVDILNSRRTKTVRISAALLALVSLAIALWFGDVIKTLLLAYTLYTCGLAVPMVSALFLHRPLPTITLRATLLVGGILGLAGTFLAWSFIVPIAVGSATAVAVVGTVVGKTRV